MLKRLIPLFLALLLSLSLCSSALAARPEDYVTRTGDQSVPRIALTVDDCYDSDHIRSIMALCEKYNVHCTFFVIGIAIKDEDADLWREIAQSPLFEIGNHTMTHKALNKLKEDQILSQLRRCQNRLNEVLGFEYPMQMMRPPYGEIMSGGRWTYVANAIYYNTDYKKIVLWNVSETDPEKTPDRVKNGSIMLFHTNAKDVRCLEQVIPVLLERGYEIVTVSELFNLDPVQIIYPEGYEQSQEETL